MKHCTALIALLFVHSACTVESGGEQSPIFAGSGIAINDEGADGRTVEIDPDVVPMVMNCAADQIVVRGASGWACGSIGDLAEEDPTVNSLAKATLGCAAGESPKSDGTAWSCAADDLLDEAAVDAFVDNNGYAAATEVANIADQIDAARGGSASLLERFTAMETSIQTLQARLFELEQPRIFADAFERSALGEADYPVGSTWLIIGGMPQSSIVSGALHLWSSDMTTTTAVAYVRTGNGMRTSRLRAAFRMAAIDGQSLKLGFGSATTAPPSAYFNSGIELRWMTGSLEVIDYTMGTSTTRASMAGFVASTLYYLELTMTPTSGGMGEERNLTISNTGYGMSPIYQDTYQPNTGAPAGSGNRAMIQTMANSANPAEIEEFFIDQLEPS